MANRVIRVLPRSLVNLTGLAAGGTAIIELGVVDVSEFTEITALVRFHPGTTVAVTAALAQIQYYANGFTDEDPAALNTATPPGFAFLTLQTLTGFVDVKGTVIPTMKVTALPRNVGSLIMLVMVVTAGSSAGNLSYAISVDLVCKNRDPGPDYLEEQEREPLLSEVMD